MVLGLGPWNTVASVQPSPHEHPAHPDRSFRDQALPLIRHGSSGARRPLTKRHQPLVPEAVYLPLVLLVVPAHGSVIFVFVTHMILRNAIGHCGVELMPNTILTAAPPGRFPMSGAAVPWSELAERQHSCKHSVPRKPWS